MSTIQQLLQVRREYDDELTTMNIYFIIEHLHFLSQDNGELFTWGKAGAHLGYELPDEQTKQVRPKRVDALSDQRVIDVSCGIAHTLSESLYLYSLSCVQKITCMHTLACMYECTRAYAHTACTESGKVFAFGTNRYGELGLSHGGPQSTSTPTHVTTLEDGIVKVSCGRHHSAAIDCEFWCATM